MAAQLDSSVAAVNQGGRRKGAACVYLETWHPDIEEFLELRDNTGEDARRTHNLNLANWIPDEFMRRVESDEMWSLIDPDRTHVARPLGRGLRRRVPDRRLAQLAMPTLFGSRNPFTFLELQDLQELSNFFERRVSAYQIGVSGAVAFDEAF